MRTLSSCSCGERRYVNLRHKALTVIAVVSAFSSGSVVLTGRSYEKLSRAERRHLLGLDHDAVCHKAVASARCNCREEFL